MPKPKTPKFSVKTHLYVTSRKRNVDGPWKPTVEEAVAAYAEKLRNQGLSHELVFVPFLAEECPKESAPSSDGKKFYRTRNDLQDTLNTQLKGAGLKLGSEA